MFQNLLKRSENRTFDEIVGSISADQVKTTHFLQELPKLMIESENDPLHKKELDLKIKEMTDYLAAVPEKQKQAAMTDDTLINIAYFARIMATVHPGWGQAGFETESFKCAIEDLYQEQKKLPKEKRLKGRSLLKEFLRITATTIQDNHLTIRTHDGRLPVEKGIKKALEDWQPTKLQYPDGQVGKNVAFGIGEEITQDDIIALEYLDDAGQKPVLVAERMVAGQQTGIIAFPSCSVHWGGKNQMQELAALRKILDAFQSHQKDWKNVIIDVRQNGGGDDFPIREVAETLYGNKVPYCLRTDRRTTTESEMRRLFPEESGCYIGPALPFKGEKKGLYILVDREVASSAEAIVPMLRHYPDVQFIGENTCGCCQYGALRPIRLPNGGSVNIGSVYRSYEDGMVECVGHKPDIDCWGRDAFQIALGQIAYKGRDNSYLKGARDQNIRK